MPNVQQAAAGSDLCELRGLCEEVPSEVKRPMARVRSVLLLPG